MSFFFFSASLLWFCSGNNRSYYFAGFTFSAKLARKLYEHMRREAASIRIQKHVRAHRARINYTTLQASAIVIQSGLRALAARNEYRYRRRTKASTKIQVNTSLEKISNTNIDHDMLNEKNWNPKCDFSLKNSSKFHQ